MNYSQNLLELSAEGDFKDTEQGQKMCYSEGHVFFMLLSLRSHLLKPQFRHICPRLRLSDSGPLPISMSVIIQSALGRQTPIPFLRWRISISGHSLSLLTLPLVRHSSREVTALPALCVPQPPVRDPRGSIFTSDMASRDTG